MRKGEIRPKFDTNLIARQILRALVKSIPIAGSGVDELSFGTYEKIKSREAELSLNFILENLGDEIKNLSETVLTEEDLESKINSLLQSQYETCEIILREIRKSIDAKDKTVSDSITNYLSYISKETVRTKSLGFDIFALPITLTPSSLKFDGIQTILKIPHRKIVIHGKPACGKTIAVKRILITAIDHPELIPIQLSAGDIGDLIKIQKRTCTKLSLPSKGMFTTLENKGRFLYIFDGLNEYRDIENLSKDIYVLSDSLINSKFLVTCRSHEYKSEAETELVGFNPFEIKDLSWIDQKKYIEEKVTNESKRNKLLAAFQQEPLLSKVCSNQFIFLMAVGLIPDEKIPPKISSEFYELYLRRFFVAWEKSSDLEDKRKFLEEIAYWITYSKDSKVSIQEDKLKKQIIKDIGVTDGKKALEELFHNGFLEKKDSSVKFFQESFQEFLLASWLIHKGIFPKDLKRNEKGYLQYKELEISKLSERFYLELSGIQKL